MQNAIHKNVGYMIGSRKDVHILNENMVNTL